MHYVGERATDVLLNRLDKTGADDPVSEVVTPELKVRKSSQKTVE
jgi:DNA-binding LacI/PurR family transcriptional regulator